MDDREAQRKLLRAKIREKRGQRAAGAPSASATAAALLRDPTGALLSMGIDDPEALANASSLVDAARSIASGSSVLRPSTDKDNNESEILRPTMHQSEIDDDEAPPPEVESDDEAPPPLS